jgi:hypothetical protein
LCLKTKRISLNIKWLPFFWDTLYMHSINISRTTVQHMSNWKGIQILTICLISKGLLFFIHPVDWTLNFMHFQPCINCTGCIKKRRPLEIIKHLVKIWMPFQLHIYETVVRENLMSAYIRKRRPLEINHCYNLNLGALCDLYVQYAWQIVPRSRQSFI